MYRAYPRTNDRKPLVRLGANLPACGWWVVSALVGVVLMAAACQPFMVSRRQTPTSAPSVPGISLYPTQARAGELILVQGSGWAPLGEVAIFLAAPGQLQAAGETVAALTADETGRFIVEFTVPTDAAWQEFGSARVVARSEDGARVVQAILTLKTPLTPLTSPTPTPTASATATATTRPSATRTPTSRAFFVTMTPSPSPTARRVEGVTDVYSAGEQVTVSAAVDLNVRAGPGLGYSVVGSLLAGTDVVVTGANADKSWLRIESDVQTQGRGWVSRAYVIADDLRAVPVVAAPQLPPTAVPTATTTPLAAPTTAATAAVGWVGEYFDNISLSGSPVLVRTDPAVDFGWGDQGPGSGLPTEFFSVRWTQTAYFAEGTYYFTVTADDGVRFWVDGSLQLDEWRDTDPTTYRPIVWLSEGIHTLQVEYYQHLANATIRVLWHRPGDWQARYYNNRKLDGEAVLERYEADIDHQWGTGAPDPSVAADNFSAVWTRDYTFEKGLYVFNVHADDGVRLWVDGNLLIDSWMDGVRSLRAEYSFDSKREREVRVEYYEHYGDAHIKLTWRRN
jgi:hypothetical protein